MNGRAVDGRAADERGENLGLFGFEVLANGTLGLASVDGRALDERGLKLGLVGLAPALANETLGFAGVDGRESGRGVNLSPVGLFPVFANVAFENVDGRWADDRGINLGLAG